MRGLESDRYERTASALQGYGGGGGGGAAPRRAPPDSSAEPDPLAAGEPPEPRAEGAARRGEASAGGSAGQQPLAYRSPARPPKPPQPRAEAPPPTPPPPGAPQPPPAGAAPHTPATPPRAARPAEPDPWRRRLDAVHAALGATRRARLGASLALALHAAAARGAAWLLPRRLALPPRLEAFLMAPPRARGDLVGPSPLIPFLLLELALLAAAARLLPARSRPRLAAAGGYGDSGWLSLLSVAAALLPAFRRSLTALRLALTLAVALLDDAAVFLLTLLVVRAALEAGWGPPLPRWLAG